VSLVALIFAVLVSVRSVADAQSSTGPPRIGLLSTGTDPARPLPPQWVAFFEAMRALGWIDGQNLQVERRFAAGRSERVPGFAAELARLGVDVIVATGLRENQAVRDVTTTIPVVMVVVDDPVEPGFVQSLARPGGNFTGVTFSTTGIGEKYVQLLKEAVPTLARVEIVVSRPQRPAFVEEMQNAARALGVALSPSSTIFLSWNRSSRASPTRSTAGSSSPTTHSRLSCTATSSWPWPPSTGSPPSTPPGNRSKEAASCPMD